MGPASANLHRSRHSKGDPSAFYSRIGEDSYRFIGAIVATSTSPTRPIRWSRMAPQLSMDSGAAGSARGSLALVSPNSSIPKLIFQRNPVRVEEIQEDAARRRVLSWSMDDRRALRVKPVQSTTDVVNFRDHEVDVMEHWTLTPDHTDAVMKRIGIRTHESHRFANAVGNTEIQHVTKEGNRFTTARRAEHDVAKPLNLGVGRLEGLVRRVVRPDVEFKRGPGVWFGNTSCPPDLSLLALGCRQLLIGDSVHAQLVVKRFEL